MSTSTTASVTINERPKRRFRSKQERRRIVEESLKPGASVALIARAHNVNANQVFNWRRLYQEGKLEVPQGSGRLLPVRVTEDGAPTLQPAPGGQSKSKVGIIDIDLGHARVRIEGAADPECVRAAVEGLMR
jgi:transposase